MSFSESDKTFMRRAIELAAEGYPAPNPHVGCVIVSIHGEIVGEGFHEYAGGPHAEVNALAQAGERAEGGTVYVTLEPCNSRGRTPPCVDALLAAKVSRVVVSVRDPNPKMEGGIERLQSAGVVVHKGLLPYDGEFVNEPWLSAVRTGKTYMVGKAAMTLDGKVALPNGRSKWITGEHARSQGQKLRAQCGSVLVGVGTAIADNPFLNVRDFPVVNQPIKMVLDPNARLSKRLQGQVIPHFAREGRWIHWTAQSEEGRQSIDETGRILPPIPLLEDKTVDWETFRAILFQQGIISCLLEGGSVTLTSAIRQSSISRLELFIAPKLFGNGADWFRLDEDLAPTMMGQVMSHQVVSVSTVGDDVWITIRLQN